MELALRQRVVEVLRPRKRAALERLGAAITTPVGNRLPCWGDVPALIDSTVPGDVDASALWDALLELAEPRVLAVTLDALRARPAFRSALVASVGRLPIALQCGLATHAELRPLLTHAALCPAAREVLGKEGERLADERAVFDSFLESLRAQRAGVFPTALAKSAVTPEASEAQPSGDHP